MFVIQIKHFCLQEVLQLHVKTNWTVEYYKKATQCSENTDATSTIHMNCIEMNIKQYYTCWISNKIVWFVSHNGYYIFTILITILVQ